MDDTSLRTITLNSESLEGAIKVLSSAAKDFGLTRRQRIVYRVLMVSVDAAIVSLAYVFLVLAVLVVVERSARGSAPDEKWFIILGLGGLALLLSMAVGMVSLLLNIPLFLRMLRERAQLKKLGAKPLSKLLWKASRRHHRLSRIRSALVIVFGALVTAMATVLLLAAKTSEFKEAPVAGAFYASVAIVLFSARHLRNQREQMDLVASADNLKKALQSLRQQAGTAGSVAVPAELIERAATIESAYIAKERKEAILQSVGSGASGYAITFADEAARQRGTLALGDRLELEDLLAHLSTGDIPAESAGPAGGTPIRRTTEGGRVAVEYVLGDSRGIRITTVSRLTEEGGRPSEGAHHA